MKKQLINQCYDAERALYALSDAELTGCIFEGEADGESALKESRAVKLRNCRFALRYPLWHARDFLISDCHMTETCRAPMWYTELGTIRHCRINGVKALRECTDTLIDDSIISSTEFGWKCKKVNIRDSHIASDYLLFDSRDLEISGITMSGKYSFQYVRNLTISNSVLNTKDAFWHTENVTVTDCEVNGEYLGWYSDGLTFINCKISGTQPLCYCKNLTLINCELTDADLSFEYSDVQADITGHIVSVKNPRSGSISADSIGEIITEDSLTECLCKIHIKQGDTP